MHMGDLIMGVDDSEPGVYHAHGYLIENHNLYSMGLQQVNSTKVGRGWVSSRPDVSSDIRGFD